MAAARPSGHLAAPLVAERQCGPSPASARVIRRSRASVVVVHAQQTTASARGGPRRPRAVIVGGGPAGGLTALLLADRGFDCVVHERRPPSPPPQEEASGDDRGAAESVDGSGHKYNVVVSPRGLAALRLAGIKLGEDGADDAAPWVVLEGSWNRKRGLDRSRAGPFAGSVSIDRGVLAGLLEAEAVRRGVRYVHGSVLRELDIGRRRARFLIAPAEDDEEPEAEGAGSGPRAPLGVELSAEVEYDLLVGADGVRSAVRAAMETQLPGFYVAQKFGAAR